jgi:hypothetical protein
MNGKLYLNKVLTVDRPTQPNRLDACCAVCIYYWGTPETVVFVCLVICWGLAAQDRCVCVAMGAWGGAARPEPGTLSVWGDGVSFWICRVTFVTALCGVLAVPFSQA